MIINDVPVICAECINATIKGKYLFCEIKNKLVYNVKSNWCPLPPLFEDERQLKMDEVE